MEKKDIHIVFKVLNFIHSEVIAKYKLLPIDKLILITLASHKGIKGIFPMQETLANELEITRRHLRTRLKYLEKHKLIFVEKISRKSHYHLQDVVLKGELQFPEKDQKEEPQFPNEDDTGELQFLSQGNYSSSHRGTTVATNNKINNKLNNSERGASAPTPLSSDFCPDQELINLCRDKGLDVEHVKKKFMSLSKRDGKKYVDHQAAFETFVLNEKTTSPKTTTNVHVMKRDPQPCSVCKRGPSYCVCTTGRVTPKEEGQAKMAEIMAQLKKQKSIN